jgi:hypothetical protein
MTIAVAAGKSVTGGMKRDCETRFPIPPDRGIFRPRSLLRISEPASG